MKCSNCGAEISSEIKICPYCNSEVVKETSVTNITNNYYSGSSSQNQSALICPKCGGNNIKFKREEIGTEKTKKTRDVLYRTVGICQSCGYTWNPNEKEKKQISSKVWKWILAILFWPFAICVWFYKTPKIKLDKKYRVIIIAGVWILLIVLAALSPSTETEPSVTEPGSVSVTEKVSAVAELTEQEKEIIEVNNVDSGKYGTAKTLNEGTEDEYTYIQYRLPAGKYSVKNAGNSAVQVSVYSDTIIKNDEGRDEPKETFGAIVLSENEEKEISIAEGQHIKLSDGEAKLLFDKIG